MFDPKTALIITPATGGGFVVTSVPFAQLSMPTAILAAFSNLEDLVDGLRLMQTTSVLVEKPVDWDRLATEDALSRAARDDTRREVRTGSLPASHAGLVFNEAAFLGQTNDQAASADETEVALPDGTTLVLTAQAGDDVTQPGYLMGREHTFGDITITEADRPE